MWNDYFKLAFRTFLDQKKRTVLTLIGVFIGIMAVVSLVSLGQGLEAGINRQFELMGTDKIFIQPGTSAGFNPVNTLKLTDKDLQAVRSTSGVDVASSWIFRLAQVKFNDVTKYTFVIGIDDTQESFQKGIEGFGIEIEEGRGVESESEIVMPYLFKTGDFFDTPVTVGDRIAVEKKKLKVVGSVSQVGNPSDDSQIYMTLNAIKKLFDVSGDELDYIMVVVKKGVTPSVVAERLERVLRKSRNVDEGDEDFIVQTTEDFIESFGLVLTVVQIVLIGIAAISLLVGGVNIANTMYTAVLERTPEIGVMKAIGATNKDIFLMFLVESGIIGITGGIIGIISGIGLSNLVANAAGAAGYSFIETLFPWYLIIGALLFSFIVGALAGTLPAIQASKLKPVDALRYE